MFAWIKKHLLLVLVLGAFVGSISFYVGIKVADLPAFCGIACHEMQPHVDTLAANIHGEKGVICMDCHSEQGFIMHAEEHIKASVLAGAHFSKVYMEDEFNLHANVQGFDKEKMDMKHQSPMEQKETFKKCLACHPNRVSGSYFMVVPKYKYDMVNENCMRCHEAIAGQKEEDSEKAKAALYKEGPGLPKGMPNTHPLHLGLGYKCTDCHARIVHNSDAKNHPLAMHDCGKCHNGTDAPVDDCKKCHVGITKIFEGKTGHGIDETSAMMADIGCGDCHNNPNFAANPQTCIDCHDDSYAAKIGEWQAAYKQAFDKAQKAHDKAEELLEIAKHKSGDITPVISIFKDGEYNLKLAKLDGSRGVHNPDFTAPLLERSEHTFNEVSNMLNAMK